MDHPAVANVATTRLRRASAISKSIRAHDTGYARSAAGVTTCQPGFRGWGNMLYTLKLAQNSKTGMRRRVCAGRQENGEKRGRGRRGPKWPPVNRDFNRSPHCRISPFWKAFLAKMALFCAFSENIVANIATHVCFWGKDAKKRGFSSKNTPQKQCHVPEAPQRPVMFLKKTRISVEFHAHGLERSMSRPPTPQQKNKNHLVVMILHEEAAAILIHHPSMVKCFSVRQRSTVF